MIDYSIERISLDNIIHLQTLYRKVFGKRVPLDFLIQKYNTAFSGAQFIGYLAFTAAHFPAAFYGVLPCLYNLKGKRILAAQSADTMTHPDHRRAGLFLKLAKETYSLARQNGVELIFGFPNQNSLPGFVKLNWIFLPAPMKMFRIPANPIPYSKIIRRIPFINNIFTTIVKQTYSMKSQPVNLDDSSRDGVVKDWDFVQYKKGYGNSFFIQIYGRRAWIKLDGLLKIGYAEVDAEVSAASFINEIKMIARVTGCSHIIFMTCQNSMMFKILSSFAQPMDSFPIGLLPLNANISDFSNAQFDYCDIDIF